VFEKGRDYSQYSLTALHGRLRNLAKTHNLPVFDILDAYRGYDPNDIKNQDKAWFDPWHPNPKGHRVAGQAIERFLIEKALVPTN
jgi:lysophospholipase L1-like esterase